MARIQRAAGNQALQSILGGRERSAPPSGAPAGGPPVDALVPPGGRPIDGAERQPVEQALGLDLSHARVHSGGKSAAAARRLGALAYTVGSHVVLGAGAVPPATEARRRVLQHELIHVAQQSPSGPAPGSTRVASVTTPRDDLERAADQLAGKIALGVPPGSVAARRGPVTVAREVPEGMVETPDPDWLYVPDPDRPAQQDDDVHAALVRNFEIEVSAVDPSIFLVPAEATRADVAQRLLDDESRAGDIVLVRAPSAVVAAAAGRQPARPRDYRALVPGASEALHRDMRRVLDTDVEWTVSKLSERIISRLEEAELAQRLLRWSQRSGIPSESGRSYFDRYLDRLHGRVLVSFWGTRKNALDWLLVEARSHQELIRKAIELRSSYTTGYTVTDERPQFRRDDVIGRFFYSRAYGSDRSIQLRVVEAVANEDTLERAETVTRNTAYQRMRVVVPGGDGRYYGYTIATRRRAPRGKYSYDMRPQPDQDPAGEFFWYHPQTVYIAPREFRVDYTSASEGVEPLRRSLLDRALEDASADDLGDLVGLDFDVLATATLDERQRVIRLVLDGRGKETEPGVSLLSRVILSTPNSDFPVLERQLSTSGLIGRLFELTRRFPALAGVGRAFTLKTLQSIPIGVESFTSMPTFRFGEDASGVLHYVAPGTRRRSSAVISPESFREEAASRLGAERGLPGEEGGAIERDVIDLQPAIFRSGIGALIENFVGSTPIAENNGPIVRDLLPTQLVKVEVLGQRPQTLYMTALEAAGALDLSFSEYTKRAIMPAVNLNLMALTAINLGFAFGPSLASGLAAGGIRGGLSALARHASTQAGRQALRSFAYEAALLTSMQVVDAYRSELEESAAGRAFLALYDVVMVMLVARDIHAVVRTGVFQRLGRLGISALAAVRGAAQRALRRTVDEIRAWSIAVPRAVRERVLVPVAAGPAGALRPSDPAAFSVMLNQARAEVATQSLMTGLEAAGASTTRARRVMEALERTPELAAAQTAVARRATGLAPAEAERFLTAVERTLGNSRGLKAELSGWLQAAAKADDAVAYLAQVDRLVARNGVSAEAISVMGSKAAAGTADINFINRAGLTDRDLSFLGRDVRTPWRAYERVASGTPTTGETIWARGSIRGASAELSAQRGFSGLLPDFRISGRQVPMDGKILDFQITLRGVGRRHGFEVKGWTQRTWQEALAAYEARAAGAALSRAERSAVGKIDHMVGQLQAAKSATGNPPYLGVTDALSAGQRETLRDLLRAYDLADTVPVFMSESRILQIGRQLRSALGLP